MVQLHSLYIRQTSSIGGGRYPFNKHGSLPRKASRHIPLCNRYLGLVSGQIASHFPRPRYEQPSKTPAPFPCRHADTPQFQPRPGRHASPNRSAAVRGLPWSCRGHTRGTDPSPVVLNIHPVGTTTMTRSLQRNKAWLEGERQGELVCLLSGRLPVLALSPRSPSGPEPAALRVSAPDAAHGLWRCSVRVRLPMEA